ncbi:MAG: serine/threonine-protein phosphatase [Candidatus Omnitrophica bacterium]|nr:serine/threonine-protein phosphatase [Candidatus Omnitrophota bacterium]
MMQENRFIEVDHFQIFKAHQHVGGDVFACEKIDNDNRIILVLSDGLGSGIKASVLATLTATMATKFIVSYRDLKSIARIIMTTLPVCKERLISYATFTIVDIDASGITRVIEYGNPAFLLIRETMALDVSRKTEEIIFSPEDKRLVYYSEFKAEFGDRIVFCSDGVTQAGMGASATPLGWGDSALANFVCSAVKIAENISARELARQIVSKAHRIDEGKAKDDITCGVIYLRQPRKTLIVSGPPIKQEKDKELAHRLKEFIGLKIIAGGTTANIVAREWEQDISVDIAVIDPEIPPHSRMEGVSLVTEGILTLCKVSEILEKGISLELIKNNAARKILEILLNSDIIHFLVGTKINDVHQDPNMPVEIEIRRTIVKKIKQLLEKKHLKKVYLEYI